MPNFDLPDSCFHSVCSSFREFRRLFGQLFSSSQKHMLIINHLSVTQMGEYVSSCTKTVSLMIREAQVLSCCAHPSWPFSLINISEHILINLRRYLSRICVRHVQIIADNDLELTYCNESITTPVQQTVRVKPQEMKDYERNQPSPPSRHSIDSILGLLPSGKPTSKTSKDLAKFRESGSGKKVFLSKLFLVNRVESKRRTRSDVMFTL